MAIVAELFDHVVGVDAHARSHTFCIIHCRTGAVVDAATFPTTKPGLARAMTWVRKRATGRLLAAVEGTSSYGTSITAAFVHAGVEVTEVRPPAKTTQANTGESDSIDAEAAARSVLGRAIERLARPRRRAVELAGERDEDGNRVHPVAQLARDLKISESCLRRWMDQADVDEGAKPGLTSAERKELVELRRENRVLRMERDLLSRAAAFFAQENVLPR
jgi:transposase-like protein